MPSKRPEYDDVGVWTREDVELALRDDVPETLCRAVIAISMHESDRRWAEDLCIKLSSHRHFNVRGNAVLGFGHIVRIHGQLDEDVVHPIIAAALHDPDEYVRGQAISAADDTAFFLGWKFHLH